MLDAKSNLNPLILVYHFRMAFFNPGTSSSDILMKSSRQILCEGVSVVSMFAFLFKFADAFVHSFDSRCLWKDQHAAP